jgi:Asp-tRNA(Asn)/Glu-tRNA(Gln) amidotransferase A subunit family amidase
MDKIGPMCRSIEDCALVFNAIYGPDGRDDTVVDAPFGWNPDLPLAKLKIGYIKSEFEAPTADGRGAGREGGAGGGRGEGRGRGGVSPEEQRRRAEERLALLNGALDVYRQAGATLHPITLPETLTRYSAAISFVLSTEAAAAFDDLTRSPGIKDESLNTWPNTFRTHRFVPAVEYIRAQRIRTLLMREMDKLMSEYDVFLSGTNSATLGLTNLTGHPAVAVRAGFVANAPLMLMVTGRLYDEATTLRVALAHERGSSWNARKPELTV